MLDRGLPVGCEFLDPITPQYISDTVAWGAIGARTTESQTHRQLGSGLSMPVGFKNGTDGNVQVAVDAVRAAAVPHAFSGIDDDGTPAILNTKGNPDGHVILRGGRGAPNTAPRGSETRSRCCAPPACRSASSSTPPTTTAARTPPTGAPAEEIAAQIAAGSGAIVGVMLESFLVEGRQDLDGDEPLTYGQSITDACIDWETTVSLLDSLAASVRSRRQA